MDWEDILVFLTHPLPWFMMFAELEMALSHMIHAWGWAVPCSVRASSGCRVLSARMLGDTQGASAEGRGLRVWHTEQRGNSCLVTQEE